MNRRSVTKRIGFIAVCMLVSAGMMVPLAGCPSQTTLAALTATLGNAGASIATIEGNAALAQKLQTDTTAAVSAVQNWKPGTPSQNAVQALQLVETDLNLISQIPGAQQYAPLISLALSTTISIIQIVDPGSVPAAVARAQVGGVTTSGAPKNAKDFKARWYAICASNAALTNVTIK